MLRLPDARSGSTVEVRQARPGVLRVCVHLPNAAAETDITALRLLLVADLLARTAELRGLQVLTALHFPGADVLTRRTGTVDHDAAALGIHPPSVRTSSGDAPSLLGGPVNVHLVSQGTRPDPGWNALLVSVGAAHLDRTDGGAGVAGGGPLAGGAGDPLAVRLALMSVPGQRRAGLTGDGLARARENLGHWRQEVARWAESPSGPIPARIMETAWQAFRDLDTGSALELLHELAADASVPAGAKFETFVYADRILGLDLAREIGRAG